jgi:hypothetical protein
MEEAHRARVGEDRGWGVGSSNKRDEKRVLFFGVRGGFIRSSSHEWGERYGDSNNRGETKTETIRPDEDASLRGGRLGERRGMSCSNEGEYRTYLSKKSTIQCLDVKVHRK